MELPQEIPVMTLPCATLFPYTMLPLYIFEPRYRRMLADVLHSHRMFSVAMQKPGRVREAPCRIAGLGFVRASVCKKDGTSNLVLQGIARVELGRTVKTRPYRVAQVRYFEPETLTKPSVVAMTHRVLDLVTKRLEQGFELPTHIVKQLVSVHAPSLEPSAGATLSESVIKQGLLFLTRLEDPGQLADLVSSTLLPNSLDRQAILETVDLEHRLRKLIEFLMEEIRRQRNDQQV